MKRMKLAGVKTARKTGLLCTLAALSCSSASPRVEDKTTIFIGDGRGRLEIEQSGTSGNAPKCVELEAYVQADKALWERLKVECDLPEHLRDYDNECLVNGFRTEYRDKSSQLHHTPRNREIIIGRELASGAQSSIIPKSIETDGVRFIVRGPAICRGKRDPPWLRSVNENWEGEIFVPFGKISNPENLPKKPKLDMGQCEVWETLAISLGWINVIVKEGKKNPILGYGERQPFCGFENESNRY